MTLISLCLFFVNCDGNPAPSPLYHPLGRSIETEGCLKCRNKLKNLYKISEFLNEHFLIILLAFVLNLINFGDKHCIFPHLNRCWTGHWCQTNQTTRKETDPGDHGDHDSWMQLPPIVWSSHVQINSRLAYKSASSLRASMAQSRVQATSKKGNSWNFIFSPYYHFKLRVVFMWCWAEDLLMISMITDGLWYRIQLCWGVKFKMAEHPYQCKYLFCLFARPTNELKATCADTTHSVKFVVQAY